MLLWILTAGAALCLLYFIAIVIYSGISTASAVIWLFFAGGLFAAAVCLHYYQNNPEKLSLRLPVTLVTLCGAGAVIMLLLQILILFQVPAVADSGLEYVIVLGGRVREDGPSKILKLRLDKAAEYALQNPETTLILSGGVRKPMQNTLLSSSLESRKIRAPVFLCSRTKPSDCISRIQR